MSNHGAGPDERIRPSPRSHQRCHGCEDCRDEPEGIQLGGRAPVGFAPRHERTRPPVCRPVRNQPCLARPPHENCTIQIGIREPGSLSRCQIAKRTQDRATSENCTNEFNPLHKRIHGPLASYSLPAPDLHHTQVRDGVLRDLKGKPVRFSPNSGAAPATVGGEPAPRYHWAMPGKAERGVEPRARIPAVAWITRPSRSGCTGGGSDARSFSRSQSLGPDRCLPRRAGCRRGRAHLFRLARTLRRRSTRPARRPSCSPARVLPRPASPASGC